ncbi:MAG: DUF881 domain-containing protein [Egibacteraceae bacterium]
MVEAIVTLGALLVGFSLTAAVSAGREAQRAANARKDELIALIGVRQQRTEELAASLAAVRGELHAAQTQAAAGLPIRAEVARMEAASGLSALRGPGLRLRIDDAKGACPTSRREDCRIQDVDLQLAVNTLFGLGAEAVAINGERVIATTAIRNAGGSVLVNYRVLVAPYEINAIGSPTELAQGLQASKLGRDFRIWRNTYGLELDAKPAKSLDLPSYTGGSRLQAATITGGQG